MAMLGFGKLEVNVPLVMLLVGMGVGAAISSCHDQQSFRDKKANAEQELALKLPEVLPKGWQPISHPSCVTWCRTMYGSEFDVEVMTSENHFTKVRISCDTEADERSCGYRRLILPCEEN